MCFTCTGHAGDVVGDTWYIVGGGNNTSGCTDTVALDLSPLGTSDQADEPLTWSTVSQAEPRSAIVSEGLIVAAIPYARCLVSFGGYNGKYHSSLQIFKPGESILPHLRTACVSYPLKECMSPHNPASQTVLCCTEAV